MSLAEILTELPVLTTAERQLLIRYTLDLDESLLSAEDEALIEERQKEAHRHPAPQSHSKR
jgi:hypothetical protein